MRLDSYNSGFLLVGGSTLLAVLGLLIFRRLLHTKSLISSHDVGGYLLSVVGTMYAVILGLIVVDAMSEFQEARQTCDRESNALADLILLSVQLPPEPRVKIQSGVLKYVDRLLEDEWPILDHGRYAPSARHAAIDLIDAVTSYEPKTDKENGIYSAELDVIREFWNARRTRTITAQHGVPPLEWVVLIVGGVITVSFTYFFKLDHLMIQIVMTAMVAVMIALCLYLVLMFGYPFSGDLKIDPTGFKVTQAIIAYQTGRSSTPAP